MRRVNITRTSHCSSCIHYFPHSIRAAVNLAILASICVFCACIYCHLRGRHDHRYPTQPSVDSNSNRIIAEDDNSEPRSFYIYNWSSDITDSWPAGYSHPRLAFEEHFKLNYGAGVAVDTEQGLYHTHQYSLFQLFYHRLLQSSRRTMDPSRASVFFIPYDLGMDGSTRRSDGALIQTNCPSVERVMQLLENSPYFRASGGSNHFALHSINQMMLYYANEPCLRLYQLCFNCTKLSIDTYSSDVYRFIAEHAFMRNKWLSIPFPSNYHLSEASSKPPWMDIIVAASSAAASSSDGTTQSSIRYIAEMYSTGRPYTFCFVGTDKVTAKLQKQLRVEVRRVCAAYSSRTSDPCLLVAMPSHGSNYYQGMLLQQRSHYSAAANTISSPPAFEGDGSRNPYRLSKFCFQPGGDFPTRKGLLDSLLSGCIPVVFELTAAHEQWPLHWGSKKTASSCIVYIPRDIAVRNMTEVFAYLTRLSYDHVFMSKKLLAIAGIGHRMQYSLPRNHSMVGGDFKSSRKEKDAFDVTIEHLLDTTHR